MAEAPAVPLRWQDLGVRTAASLALIPAVVLDIWMGGVWFELMVALLGVLMAREYVAIVHGDSPSQFALHAAAALSGAVLAGNLAHVLWMTAALAALSIGHGWWSGGGRSFWSLAGVPYVALPVAALVVLRDDTAWGVVAILFLFIAVWAADILAYFAGRIIGGPRLWPRVSPNKTWAGLAGAVAGGALAGVGVALAHDGLSPAWLAALGGLIGLVEQGGDLCESALKRHYGVKDSGNLIPGHGGVLDRVDGLAAAAVFAAAWGLTGSDSLAPAQVFLLR